MTNQSYQNARREGELKAVRELVRLGIDLTKPIDVFDVVMREQLWLMFQPLKDVLGTYVPGGVLINSERTLPIQRITAAHEYGHHVLHGKSSVDKTEDIVGDPNAAKDSREVAARAFAMDFLMPVQLVNSLWKRLHLPNQVSCRDVYLLSLHLGASYEATIYQLIAQKKISPSDGQSLLVIKPREIKRATGFGKGPANPWADVWPLERDDSEMLISVGMDDEICISLPESPSTGYVWSIDCNRLPELSEMDSIPDDPEQRDATLGLIGSQFEITDGDVFPEKIGAGGSRIIRLRALRPGKVHLEMPLARPWLEHAAPADQFLLDVSVQEKINGLPQRQQLALLAA